MSEIRKHLAALHEKIAGSVLSEKELEEHVLALTPKDGENKKVTGQKLAQALKMQLIRQTKYTEARTFDGAYEKLKKRSPQPEDHDLAMRFLYSMYKDANVMHTPANRAVNLSEEKPNFVVFQTWPTPKQATDTPQQLNIREIASKFGELVKPKRKIARRSISNESVLADSNNNPIQKAGSSNYMSTDNGANETGITVSPLVAGLRSLSLNPINQQLNPTPVSVRQCQDPKLQSEEAQSSVMKSSELSDIANTPFRNASLRVGQQAPTLKNEAIPIPKLQGPKAVRLFKKASNSSTDDSIVNETEKQFEASRSVEKDLIKDLIYIFQGIDGVFIKCDASGKYQILQTKFPVSLSMKVQVLKLAEIGTLYKKLRKHCDKSIPGNMLLGPAIEQELLEFYRILAVIQYDVQKKVARVDSRMQEEKPQNGEGEMTLLKLKIWVFDIVPRFQVLTSIIEACGDKKGGEICSELFKFTQHGDPTVSKLATGILAIVAKPMYLMLCQWILYGDLADPFTEFFIASEETCHIRRLWQEKYSIRKKMLPSFITMETAKIILATGKNINYLKACQNTKGYEGKREIQKILERCSAECLFMEEDLVLNRCIKKAYQSTSALALRVILEDSRLLEHLTAIKHYMLLGQGDFARCLLESLQDKLSKPADKVFYHELSATVDYAIRNTNSQFGTEEVRNRLDIRIFPGKAEDLGWDVFSLEYKAQGPIGTILTEDVMMRYYKIFNSLLRMKRTEMILSTLWKDQINLSKCQRIVPELGPILHRSQLLIHDLRHFFCQMQYFLFFETVECAWTALMDDISKSSDLDQIISAHEKFLKVITNSQSKKYLNQLREIFDGVHEVKNFLVALENYVGIEMQIRKQKGTIYSEEREVHTTEDFVSNINKAERNIEIMYKISQNAIGNFLLLLNQHETMQSLSFRLDFNQYHHLKDPKLTKPLTLQHRRLSSQSQSYLTPKRSGNCLDNSKVTPSQTPVDANNSKM